MTPPSITINGSASAVKIDVGQVYSLACSAETTYQWKYSTDGTIFSNCAGSSTTQNYSWTAIASVVKLECVCTPDGTSNVITVTSDYAALTANIVVPANIGFIVTESELLTLNVSGGTPTLSYQWVEDGTNLSGKTSATCVYLPTVLGAHLLTCIVTDSATTPVVVTTASVTITVYSLYQTLAASNGYLGKIAKAVE